MISKVLPFVFRWNHVAFAFLMAACLSLASDALIRISFPPPNIPGRAFFPASKMSDVEVVGWPVPLVGEHWYGGFGWNQTNVRMHNAVLGAFAPIPLPPNAKTVAGESPAPAPSRSVKYDLSQAVDKLGLHQLRDVKPFEGWRPANASFSTTQFGFPFRSSQRELVEAVLFDHRASASFSPTRIVLSETGVLAGEIATKPPALGGRATREVLLPLGALANVLSFAATVFILIISVRQIRHFFRKRGRRCPACGYSLAGLPAVGSVSARPATCPECGQPVGQA